MNILIVEDDKFQWETYEDNIEAYNNKKNLTITYEKCQNYEEGIEALKTPYYDAAIIDLKLSDGEQLEGKKLIDEVYKKIRVPIIVYSGSIAEIDDVEESALLRKRLRTDPFESILDDIHNIYNTGITSFLRPNGIVDQKLTEIFWTNLSADINIWINHNNQHTLLRYILSYFQEHLEINPDGDFDEYHPAEVYLKPPIKKNIHTGDLIVIDEEKYIILTPACDIVINYKVDKESGKKIPFRKSDNIVLAKVIPFDYKKFCVNDNGKIDKGKLNEYIRNGNYRYHYLPPFQKDDGFLIDFQNLSSVSYDVKHSRLCTISSPFIKDIISRFSNYYSRQGQPTFMQQNIINKLLQKAKDN